MNKKNVLNGFQSEKFLSKYIHVSESQLVNSFDQIKIKPPLALKIMSPNLIHKSDIGAIKFVNDSNALESSFNTLIKLSKSRRIILDGIMVQKFVKGEQLIIGIKKDPVFNHIILFGIGGIFTEVFEDTSIRKCPINENDVDNMINDLRASKIFRGYRGKKLNIKVLKNSLINISKIPNSYKNIKEMDINPYILNERTGTVVDARIVFE